MKSFSPALLNLVMNANDLHIAHLFNITLRNGASLTATDGQYDIDGVFATSGTGYGRGPYGSIPYGGGTSGLTGLNYYATKYGKWTRGPVTSEASFQPKANSMDLTLAALPSVNLPGTSIPMTQTVVAKMFDKATVIVYRAFMPIGQWGFTGNGVETLFAGFISSINAADRNKVVFTVQDFLYVLNQPMPKNLYQSGCRHTLFDSNCTLNAASFMTANSVASGSTQAAIKPSVALSSALTYAQGQIIFTSGNNSGLTFTIKSYVGGVINLVLPVSFPFVVGDTFNVLPGCDKTLPTCTNVYDNEIHFGGEPFTPVPETWL